MVSVQETPPTYCNWCETKTELDHWFWQKGKRYRLGGTWRCRVKKNKDCQKYFENRKDDVERESKAQQKKDIWYRDKATYLRYKAYRAIDKKLNRIETIEWWDAQPLMEEHPCYYCGLTPAGGLDRIDNTLGHSLANVRPACMRCNGVLIDLPVEIKDLIAPALRKATEENLWNGWYPPHLRKIVLAQKERMKLI